MCVYIAALGAERPVLQARSWVCPVFQRSTRLDGSAKDLGILTESTSPTPTPDLSRPAARRAAAVPAAKYLTDK